MKAGFPSPVQEERIPYPFAFTIGSCHKVREEYSDFDLEFSVQSPPKIKPTYTNNLNLFPSSGSALPTLSFRDLDIWPGDLLGAISVIGRGNP
jgi:hypothetical protein